MIISLGPFQGIAPGVNAALLHDSMAQTAQNADFRHGDLRPLRGTAVLSTQGNPDLASCFFYAGVWRAWEREVSVILNPSANEKKRCVAAGVTVDGPMEWDSDTATGAVEPAGYLLGVPVPSAAPTITLGTGGGCAVADQTSITFAFAYLSTWGGVTKEGPLSDPTEVVDVCDAQSLTLGGFPALPTGNYNLTHRRLYGSMNGTYFFLADIPVADASYTWAFSADGFNTATVAPSPSPIPPPATLRGLVRLPNGIALAFHYNEILISEPFQLHAWPEEYKLSTDYPITALLPIGNAVAVLTEGSPYLLEGSEPLSMQLRRLESAQACASRWSAVDMGDYGMYAGTDGLVKIYPTGETEVVTAPKTFGNGPFDIFTPDQWKAQVNPASVRGFNWRGSYVGFYAVPTGYSYMTVESLMGEPFDAYTTIDGGFIFDPGVPGMRTLDFTVQGGRTIADDFPSYGTYKAKAGMLAVIKGGDIVEFGADSAGYLTATWKSKVFRLPRSKNFSAAQVVADAYPVTLRVYSGATVRSTSTVTSNKPFRLPAGFRDDEISAEVVTAAGAVRQVLIAESIRELSAV